MASLKLIAAEIGVSYTLVSKVLSGRLGTTGVSASTKEAILAKALELDYQPNRLAVALKAGRKGAVGIFLHQMGSPGSDVSDRLLHGLAEGLEQSGLRMWLRFFKSAPEFVDACDRNLRREVDGLIVAGVNHPELLPKLKELEKENVQIVTMFSELDEKSKNQITNVAVDYEMQGYLATKHLLDSGMKQLACLRTLPLRTEGFMRAHREAGIPVNKRLIPMVDSFFASNGRESVQALLALKLPFDGIVCHSDAQASGAVIELLRQGIRVPEDVKITGVDNSPIAEHCVVPVSTVTSEMRVAGLYAVQALLKKIQGETAESAVIPPRLIVRESSMKNAQGLVGID